MAIAVEAEDLYALFSEQAKQAQVEAGAKNLEAFKNGDSLVSEKIHELGDTLDPETAAIIATI